MPRRFNSSTASVERNLPDRRIVRRQRVQDERHITMDHRTFIHELPPEVVKELYEANPWAKRIAEQRPDCQEKILALLKQGQAEEGRIRDIDLLINEAFGKIPWAYDVTRTGTKMRESRAKTAAELYKSHKDSIHLEVLGLRKSLEFQKKYIEGLRRGGFKGVISWLRPLKNIKRIATRRAAIKTLRLNMRILPEWERTAEETRQRLTQVFNRLEAQKTREGFTQKDMEIYANAFAGVMEDYSKFTALMRRTLIGPYAAPTEGRFSVLGKSYAQKTKKGLKGVGLEPTEAFKQVMVEIGRTIRRERNAMRLVDNAGKGTGKSQAERVATLAAARQD